MNLQLALSLITIAGLALLYFELRKLQPSIEAVGKTATTTNSFLGKLGL